MDKKILGVVTGIAVIIAVAAAVLNSSSPDPEIITILEPNEKIGLVINSPNQFVTLQELDQIYSKASSTEIGRASCRERV